MDMAIPTDMVIRTTRSMEVRCSDSVSAAVTGTSIIMDLGTVTRSLVRTADMRLSDRMETLLSHHTVVAASMVAGSMVVAAGSTAAAVGSTAVAVGSMAAVAATAAVTGREENHQTHKGAQEELSFLCLLWFLPFIRLCHATHLNFGGLRGTFQNPAYRDRRNNCNPARHRFAGRQSAASGRNPAPESRRRLAHVQPGSRRDRYSPLTQINTTNVEKLTKAWSFRLPPETPLPASRTPSATEVFQEVTPIVVNGVMYMPVGGRVVALEPESGKEIWTHELKEGLASFRGVTYWPGEGIPSHESSSRA